ncbi:MAG TPA: hypothetical protein VJU61_22110, partial [Polyangiaceae bacterium]|nr:hypothetical protein [Polyangiaceae bacterium]
MTVTVTAKLLEDVLKEYARANSQASAEERPPRSSKDHSPDDCKERSLKRPLCHPAPAQSALWKHILLVVSRRMSSADPQDVHDVSTSAYCRVLNDCGDLVSETPPDNLSLARLIAEKSAPNRKLDAQGFVGVRITWAVKGFYGRSKET